MILLFAAPPHQPMLINSASAIPRIIDVPRPLFGAALVAHLSSQPQPESRWDSVEIRSVKTPNTVSLLRNSWKHPVCSLCEETHPYENSPSLSEADSELKLMSLIKYFVIFTISVWKHTWCLRAPRIINLCQFEPNDVYLSYESIAAITVTLLIINLHSLLPAGRQLVSLCFHKHSLGGSCDDGVVFFPCSEEEEDVERRAGSMPPSAVKMYLCKHWQWEDWWPESALSASSCLEGRLGL